MPYTQKILTRVFGIYGAFSSFLCIFASVKLSNHSTRNPALSISIIDVAEILLSEC